MKFLKGLLIVIVALAAILYGGGMLLSPKSVVVRSQKMAAPPDKVYPLIAAPRAWQRWSVWTQRDPAMQIDYSGPESGAGAVWAWKSKTEGDGRMSFTAATPPSRVGYELFFPDFGTTSTGDFRIEADGSGSLVTWTMNADMGSNPLYRWMGLFMDHMVGKDFEDGLAKLKVEAEK